MNTRTLFSVRYTSGAHVTQTVHGQRASSTSSYEEAARQLAAKLHPREKHKLTLISSGVAVQVFELEVLP